MQIMKVKQFKLVNQPVTLHLSHNDISIELRVVTDKDHLCSVDDKCLNVSSQYKVTLFLLSMLVKGDIIFTSREKKPIKLKLSLKTLHNT